MVLGCRHRFKMKHLKPSLKEKKRYLVFEVVNAKANKDTFKSIKLDAEKTLGLFISASAGIQFIKFKGNRALFRVSHKYVDHLKAALLFNHFVLKSVGVSGILKKAESNYLKGGM